MNSQKPPLGLIPSFIIDEQRESEIIAAIRRYNDAGHSIPREWKDELNEINIRLKRTPKCKKPNFISAMAIFYQIFLIEYWAVYIVKTFIIFRFTNPFAWIFEIPYVSDADRAAGLSLFTIFFLIQFVIIYVVQQDKYEKLC